MELQNEIKFNESYMYDINENIEMGSIINFNLNYFIKLNNVNLQ